jgi:hypothetical protein
MDVFLIPLAVDEYEPYCEVPDEPVDPASPRDEPRRWYSGLHDRFREMLAAAERERAGRHDEAAERARSTWWGRLRGRVLRWVSERIAEQRLLWHLRRHESAVLVHPSDLDGDRALTILFDALSRDGDRHRRWLIIDAILLIASSVLTIIPGPNVIWWFFVFRVVGHYLSWRGAGSGRTAVSWSCRSSPELADLRQVIALDPEDRAGHVIEIAARLQLQHLARFFERMTLRTA